MNDIYNDGMIELSLFYAKEYQLRPKVFISCFLKDKSVRMVCEEIVNVYKKIGAYEVKKDFTEWVNKQKLEEKWKRVLSEVLAIIYSIING